MAVFRTRYEPYKNIGDKEILSIVTGTSCLLIGVVFSFKLAFSLFFTTIACYLYHGVEERDKIPWDKRDLIDTLLFSTGATAVASFFNQVAITALLFFNVSGSFIDGLLGQLIVSQHYQKFGSFDITLVENFRGTFLGVYSSFVGLVLGAGEYLVDQNGSLFQALSYFLLTFILSAVAMEAGILFAKDREKRAQSNLLAGQNVLFINLMNNMRVICLGLSVFTLLFSLDYQLFIAYILAFCGCQFGNLLSKNLEEILVIKDETRFDAIDSFIQFSCNLVTSILALIVLLQCEFVPSVCKFDEILIYEFTESFLGSASTFISSAQTFHALIFSMFNISKSYETFIVPRVIAEISVLFTVLFLFHLLS